MCHRLFELFAKMVADLPVRAIPRVLDIECQMLEADAQNNRVDFPEDAHSILCFRQFVQAAKMGHGMVCPKPVRPDHIEFLKETVIRLVLADELPPSAMDQFDDSFIRPDYAQSPFNFAETA